VLVSPRDVRDLLKIYGVPDDQRDSLIQLARDSRQKGWWHAYADGLQPQFASYELPEPKNNDRRPASCGRIRSVERRCDHRSFSTDAMNAAACS
jgi:hypothetical protein